MSETEAAQNVPGGTTQLPGHESRRDSWPSVLAGLALFALGGLHLILGEIPHEWAIPPWVPGLRRATFLGTLLLPAVGFSIGWVKGFPRWSYPHLGYLLLTSWYMTDVATPGLRLFGHTFGRNDLWGWRAWIPFLVAVAVALPITRSLRPILKLFRDVWQDWTRLCFGLFGSMPLLVALSFDEVDRLVSLPFMVILTLVMMGTALVVLRSTHQRPRALALLVGITVAVTVMAAVPTVYWLENGWVNVGGGALATVIVVAVMLSPALIGVLRRAEAGPPSA